MEMIFTKALSGGLKNKKKELRLGFTLVEVLVALAILSIILLIVVTTFMAVLSRSAKVKVIKAVEDDGKHAVRVMEIMIRNAQEILPNTAGQTCMEEMSSLKIRNSDGGETEFSCLLTDGYLASSSARLTSPVTNLTSCQFNCYPGGVNRPDRVKVAFVLEQSGSPGRVEERALLNFETTITLRNY